MVIPREARDLLFFSLLCVLGAPSSSLSKIFFFYFAIFAMNTA
jgi:hypothetical protein